MCKVLEILYGCGHPHSYPLIQGCHARCTSGTNLCGHESREIIQSVTLADYPYCIDNCFEAMRLDIQIRHLSQDAELLKDARNAGWTGSDAKGSLLDLEREFEQELDDLREVCSVAKEDEKLMQETPMESEYDVSRVAWVIPERDASEVFEKSATPVRAAFTTLDSCAENLTDIEFGTDQLENDWFEACLALAGYNSTLMTSQTPIQDLSHEDGRRT